jgi:hypothetical protein
LRSLINIRRDSLHFVAAPASGAVVLAAPEDDSVDASKAGDRKDAEERPHADDTRKSKCYMIQVMFK